MKPATTTYNTSRSRDKGFVHDEVQFNIKKAFYFVSLKFAGFPEHHILTDYDSIIVLLYGRPYLITYEHFT
jgi:hypothetical protein